MMILFIFNPLPQWGGNYHILLQMKISQGMENYGIHERKMEW